MKIHFVFLYLSTYVVSYGRSDAIDKTNSMLDPMLSLL
jgi:hypothetical protein